MRILLDTHVLLWWLDNSPHLPAAYRSALADTDNECAVSAVSIWEIAIKASIGKLALGSGVGPLETLASRSGLDELSITGVHAAAVRGLPMHHSDPFDRLLIAQALTEGMNLASCDDAFAPYSVSVLPREGA